MPEWDPFPTSTADYLTRAGMKLPLAFTTRMPVVRRYFTASVEAQNEA